jgi:hypothetical protein
MEVHMKLEDGLLVLGVLLIVGWLVVLDVLL